jgi:hypothetical protein
VNSASSCIKNPEVNTGHRTPHQPWRNSAWTQLAHEGLAETTRWVDFREAVV